ncbi:hypothetical protein [Streptomyces novaecaesareae]|uniref:hypothetical protein n=1 Tax=Streptomyces novaecaesareae TaxID=68244 RepID=UPI0004AADD0C|nr:hypothetical protein [Streptomyces novaecaesareae]
MTDGTGADGTGVDQTAVDQTGADGPDGLYRRVVGAGVPSPELPPDTADFVVGLLARLAVRRHGWVGVLRALSRAERAPGSVAAF